VIFTIIVKSYTQPYEFFFLIMTDIVNTQDIDFSLDSA